jgi:hypothetical protein
MAPLRPGRGSFAEEAVDRWLHRIPDAHRAYAQDPMYFAQLSQFRTMLGMVEMALEDNDIEPEKRRQVINTVVYGCPNIEPALWRMDEAERRATRIGGLSINTAELL